MAEALFEEDGPLEQYLRDAREVLVESTQSMPGTSLQIGDEMVSASGLDWEQPLRFLRRRRGAIERHDHEEEHEDEDEVLEGYTDEELEAMEWRPKMLIVGLELLESFLNSTRPPATLSPFVEKFKYIVISSSLLSTSLSSSTSLVNTHHPHVQHKPTSSEDAILPGKLALPPPTLRVPSDNEAASPSSTGQPTSPSSTSATGEPLPPYAYLSLAALVASVLLSLERRWLATLSLGGFSYLAYNLLVGPHEETSSYDFTPTLNALDDLINANKTWETIVQDSIQYLEREEASLMSHSSGPSHPRPSSKSHMTSPSYSRSSVSYNTFTSPLGTKSHHVSPSFSSSSRTPSNALRIALNSTLQTTRNQCENVRQLFSALTCPSELAQLSVMYAPPSPAIKSPLLLPVETPSSFSNLNHSFNAGPASPRPYSFPPRSSPSSPDVILNKRSTWGGAPAASSAAYSSLASLSSPTTPFRRRDRMSLYQRTGVPSAPNLSALFEGGSPTPSTGSVNTPVTPFQTLQSLGMGGTQSLAQIAEDLHGGGFGEREEEGQVLEFPSHLSSNPSVVGDEDHVRDEEEVFGSVALGLQKKRKVDGMGVFGSGLDGAFELSSPPPLHSTLGYERPGSLFSSNGRSPPGVGMRSPHQQQQQQKASHRLSTFTSSSRFTSIQPPKHPLSLFAIHQALQAALLSRRYTCSHLLALRFSEEASLSSSTSSNLTVSDPAEREEYWENVKSVVELLTTTFEGEAARLSEALEDVERQWGLDEIPTPNVSGEFGDVVGDGKERLKENSLTAVLGREEEEDGRREKRVWKDERISFAPVPSHLSRFAAHVAAISGALEDAREQLEEVVATLKADASSSNGPSPSLLHGKKKSSLSISVFPHASQALYGQAADGAPSVEGEDEEGEEHKALQAYERLRRELGLALRECERGRQQLTEIVHPATLPSSSSDDEEGEGVPSLANDTSDDSDKPEPVEEESQVELVTEPVDRSSLIDELLLQRQPTLEQELAVDGIEQVYEADTGLVGDFTRERSKLSREERIQAVRAQREKAASRQSMRIESLSSSSPVATGGGDASYTGKLDKWGPGGEVVQELKDVIWQVGERKRKKMEQVKAEKGKEEKDVPVVVKGLEVVEEEEDPSSLLPYL